MTITNDVLIVFNFTENNLPQGYLKPETMATIWKPVPNINDLWDADCNYAMGWAVVDRDPTYGQCRKGRHLVSHTGGAVGFSSTILIVPSTEDESSNLGNQNDNSDMDAQPHGIVVAIGTNIGGKSVYMYRIAVQIADIFQNL